jgi:transposase
MTSLTDLREVVDVVIGVDTHVHTHSAAVVDAATGGVLGEITVDATAEGYVELVEFAGEHSTLRVWAIEGTGGHGAGLSRHLLGLDELVVELDGPKRARRRNGAKSDPLDAIRAARQTLARDRLGSPRSGGDRQALSVLLAARGSAVRAATEAQQQLFSLVIAAPEPIRARFRGQKLPGMLATAASLRVHPSWDVETTTTVVALRSLARRWRALNREAAEHQKAILAIIRSWRPDLLEQFGVGPIVAATVLCAWSHPGTDPLRGRVRDARRCGAHPGQQRPGDQPLPPQPLRRPTTQPSTTHRRPVPNPVSPSHPRLRRAPYHRGQDQPRDQTLPVSLRRSRHLPPPRKRANQGLTNHRSVALLGGTGCIWHNREERVSRQRLSSTQEPASPGQ